jgi:hypothetical protein
MSDNDKKTLTHEEKIQWMAVWAVRNKLQLNLEGECGFGRECVGVSADGNYPKYLWYDSNWDRLDPNGEVWTPPDAYHKSPCVAVLRRGEEAEGQLYDWLRWFDDNGFKLETGKMPRTPELERLGALGVLLGKDRYARMVRPEVKP